MQVIIVVAYEELSLQFILERSPVAANNTIMSYYWLKDATVVMGFVAVFGR